MLTDTTPPFGPQASPADRLARLARGVVALIGSGVMAVVVWWSWMMVDGYARHLCGWPARISCTEGSPVFWLVPAGLGVVASASTLGLLVWVVRRTHRVAWLGVLWLVGFAPTVLLLGPRRLDWGDVAAMVLYILAGLAVATALAVRDLPAKRRLIIAIAMGAAAVTGAAFLLPTILSSTAA